MEEKSLLASCQRNKVRWLTNKQDCLHWWRRYVNSYQGEGQKWYRTRPMPGSLPEEKMVRTPINYFLWRSRHLSSCIESKNSQYTKHAILACCTLPQKDSKTYHYYYLSTLPCEQKKKFKTKIQRQARNLQGTAVNLEHLTEKNWYRKTGRYL